MFLAPSAPTVAWSDRYDATDRHRAHQQPRRRHLDLARPRGSPARGSLEASLLPEGTKVGDILRAEAEFEIDGIVVTSVQAPKGDARVDKAARIEIIGSGRDSAPGGVSVVFAPGGRRREADGDGHPRRSSPGAVPPRARNGAPGASSR